MNKSPKGVTSEADPQRVMSFQAVFIMRLRSNGHVASIWKTCFFLLVGMSFSTQVRNADRWGRGNDKRCQEMFLVWETWGRPIVRSIKNIILIKIKGSRCLGPLPNATYLAQLRVKRDFQMLFITIFLEK